MPFVYSDFDLNDNPQDKLTGKDLGITLDIGGSMNDVPLSPQDEMAKKFGVAIQDTMQTGINIATKLPGVEPVAKFISESPIGWLGGKALDALNVPSWLIQQGAARLRLHLAQGNPNDLPQDIRNMLASGANIDEVADYMYNSGRAFSNDRAANLFWQVVLDPLNFTPLALGKVNLLKSAKYAGGILGGAAVAGPIGAAAGAAAAWKGAAVAKKAASMLPGAEKVEDILGPTRAELGAKTALEKITDTLSKPRGLDLGKRVPAGARNLAQLEKIDNELDAIRKEGVLDEVTKQRIVELESSRKRVENAMSVGNDVTNGFAIGVYKGLVGTSEKVNDGSRAIAAALGVPVTQKISLALGGYKFNQVMDTVAELLPQELRSVAEEMFGRGAANIGIIATTRMLAGPEAALSRSIAEVTYKQFNEAVEILRAKTGMGADVAYTTDEIAQMMIERAKTELGGTNSALRISDTPEGIRELKERIDVVRNSKAEIQNGAFKSDAALKKLSVHVENQVITSKLSSLGTSEKASAKVVDIMREMGPDGVARLVADEIDKLIYEMLPKVKSREVAKTEFASRIKSIRAAMTDGTRAGADDALLDAQINQKFDELFGNYYDETGKVKRETMGKDDLKDAARAMVAIDMASFASANKTATRINQEMRMFLTEDPDKISEMVAKLGQEKFDDMRRIARRFIGTGNNGVMLVRKSFLFGATAQALVDVHSEIRRLTEDARSSVSRNAETRVATGQPMLHTVKGSKAEVDALRTFISEKYNMIWKTGDKRTVDLLAALRRDLAKAQDLDEARVIWKKTALESAEDIKSLFGDASGAQDIARYLQSAIDDGFAATNLSPREVKELRRFLEMSGMDAQMLENFTGRASGGRYVTVRATSAPYSNVTTLLRNPAIDDSTKAFIYQTKVTPFIDMTAPVLDEVGAIAPRYNASKMQELVTGMFSPIGTKQVTANIKNRLAAYLARGGITTGQADAIMDEVIKRAMDNGVSARGLARDQIDDAFATAFRDYSGSGSYEIFKDSFINNLALPEKAPGFDALKAIMYAFEGDLKVVGATQKFTGKAKMAFPAIAKMTDNIYPTIRFKMNPLYWLQEWLESPTLNKARGINDEVLKVVSGEGKTYSLSADKLKDLSSVGPEAHSIIDNVSFLTVFRNKALENALDTNWGRMSTLEKATSARLGERLTRNKEMYKDRAAMNLAAQNFYKTLAEQDPTLLNSLITQYNTSDSVELFVRYVDMRDRLRSVDRVLTDIEASRPASFGFRRIPDKKGEALVEFKANTIGGVGADDTVMTIDDILRDYINNPYPSAIDLGVQAERLRDAGYDMSIVNPALAELKASLYAIDDIYKGNPRAFTGPLSDAESAAVAGVRKAQNKLSQSIVTLENYYADAVLRRHAAQVMMLDTPLALGGEVSYEAGIMAQALALGHSYSSEIADLTSTLQRIVVDAKRELGIVTNSAKVPPSKQAALYEAISRRASEAVKTPTTLDALTTANYELLAKHGNEEKLFRAFEHVYEKSLRQANQITYFNPDRSWLERSINHPFLGFYPYSYMFKKILPELANFLFKKPFGVQAPGAGYQAYMHFRQYFENEMETDYTFRKFMEDNDQVAFMITQLFPGVPWDISAMPPGYVRKIATSLAGKDKDYTFEDIIARDVIGSIGKMGPLSSIPSGVGAAQQIIDQLTGGNQPKLGEFDRKADKDYFDIY
jgi:hypothetical protein